jgi:hypothetical protein
LKTLQACVCRVFLWFLKNKRYTDHCHSSHTATAYHYRQDSRTARDGEEPIECVTGHLGIPGDT